MFYICLPLCKVTYMFGEKKCVFTKINLPSQFIQILGVCVEILLYDILAVLELEVILTCSKESND